MPRGVDAQGENRMWTPRAPAPTFMFLLSYEVAFSLTPFFYLKWVSLVISKIFLEIL